jgi:2-oxoglutarate dehydrogenase E1 component
MAAGSLLLDWGFAETLAYATLLTQGHPIRLSGQDAGRGTFFHRHAVLHNQKDGSGHVPLQHLSEDQAEFLVIDSFLSEEAVLGFEYGYATAEPNSLVIWEAQFGDFANGAQVVIDQFIAAGEAKWGRLCGLVMMLPHGYEGQGPEHSSARPERYKQLCAEHNIQLCMPTTPGQMFHLLRRQHLRPYRKPLIIFTPKSLLRHKLSTSRLEVLVEGRFQPIIAEMDNLDPQEVVRIILCSGKVYYDLLETRRSRGIKDAVIIRLEQLYPFPKDELARQVDKYPNAHEFIWCQEEPQNQGMWDLMKHRFHKLQNKGYDLRYAGRPASASPAVGNYRMHVQQQETLVDEALSGQVNPAMNKKDKL